MTSATTLERVGATPWFGPTELPVRSGCYEAEWTGGGAGVYLNYFDCQTGVWHYGYKTTETFMYAGQSHSPIRGRTTILVRWRGLTYPFAKAPR